MKIALAQLSLVVGDLTGNRLKIARAYEEALASGARVCVTPELSLLGYPPLDLLDRPDVWDRCDRALDEISKITVGKSCALVVGHAGKHSNQLSVIENGRVVHTQSKILLPTYDVFDESRYFEPGGRPVLWNCDGKRVAFLICEDLWAEGTHHYTRNPVDEVTELKPDLLIAIAASPYEKEKAKYREGLHQDVAKKIHVPLVYVNQTGATDEVLFDGRSFICDSHGEKKIALKPFEEEIKTVDVSRIDTLPSPETPASEMEVLALGLVEGIRSYFERTGFKKAILGLSGGIDSAVVAVLAVRALGAKNVHGVAMPSQYSSNHSIEDAQMLADHLGVKLETQPISEVFEALHSQLSRPRGGALAPLAQENLQSRIRGLYLMTLSNHEGSLVITTGNKSEIAMGYCTMYGDMVGALTPIGDLYKTEVYDLANWINSNWDAPIPPRSIAKAPSAELRPNQTDQDSLPPYEVLDPILRGYLERGQPVTEATRSIIRTVEINEYKRRQAAPALKTSAKAFGIGRRIPVAKRWDQN